MDMLICLLDYGDYFTMYIKTKLYTLNNFFICQFYLGVIRRGVEGHSLQHSFIAVCFFPWSLLKRAGGREEKGQEGEMAVFQLQEAADSSGLLMFIGTFSGCYISLLIWF